MNVVFLSQTHPLGFKIFHKPVSDHVDLISSL